MWENLKDGSRENHQKLEKTFVGRLRQLSSVEDYAGFMSRLHAFYHPLEKSIDRFVSTEVLPDYPHRRRSKRILDDITALGYNSEVSGTPPLPEVSTLSHAIGALYVVEGSTHGGPVIAGMLRRQFDLPPHGLSYFSGYGQHTTQKWEEFKDHINASAANLSEHLVLQSANSTFNNLNIWLSGRG